MGTIQVLDQATIDKIAAGEVVERPASVVKELVENALDARATAITVEIRDGGISFLRITDNGGGIPSDQVPLAFLRHATSKIRSVEDLTGISSLGFRGEALSSISAVAQVEMITKVPDDIIGTRYLIEGGMEKEKEEVGAPTGTTILVRNLFYNTPARKKFLRTAVTEANAVTQVMEQLALSHPDVSFHYMVNSQPKLHTSGNGNRKELVYAIYGRDMARELIEVHSESDLMKVAGFIGKPVISRGNRNFENYFVKGRYVRSRLLARAIEDGYHTSMMQHKYPFTLLYLDLDGSAVDVNVHPSKMEVRFSHQEEIYRQITEMISDGLNQKEQIVKVSLSEESGPKKAEKKEIPPVKAPEPFETARKESFSPSSYPAGSPRMPIYPEQKPEKASEPCLFTKEEEALFKQQTFPLPEETFLTKEAEQSHRILGQIFDTYWLVEYQDSLFIIDQHAAHEKVMYERLMKNYREKKIYSQMVSPPILLTLTPMEADRIRRYQEVFSSFGFEISAFGGNDFSVSAVPDNLYGIATEELLIELLDHLEEVGDKPLEIITDRLAVMSCKAAVKGNQGLSYAEAESLISELLTLEDPYHCPHGRPTILSLSRKELEKKFKRIV